MKINDIKIISEGNGLYSSNVEAIELESENKNMSPKEFYTSLISNIKMKG